MNEKIIPFTYRPSADKRRAFPLFFILIGCAAVFVAASLISPLYRGLLSLVAVFLLTGAVLVYQRYITADYIYAVREGGEGEAAFVVTKRVGKRVTTLAYAQLYSIKCIEFFTKDEYKARAKDKNIRKYNLVPTYSPDYIYVISLKNPNGEFEIAVDITSEVRNRILEYRDYALADELARRESFDEE